jgi:hypothetical protein
MLSPRVGDPDSDLAGSVLRYLLSLVSAVESLQNRSFSGNGKSEALDDLAGAAPGLTRRMIAQVLPFSGLAFIQTLIKALYFS